MLTISILVVSSYPKFMKLPEAEMAKLLDAHRDVGQLPRAEKLAIGRALLAQMR